MRVYLTLDSGTPQEAHDFVCAFQRTAGIALPQQLNTECTVRIGGSAMSVRTPALTPRRAGAMWAEFERLTAERTAWTALTAG